MITLRRQEAILYLIEFQADTLLKIIIIGSIIVPLPVHAKQPGHSAGFSRSGTVIDLVGQKYVQKRPNYTFISQFCQ